jgi:hypothetical protein
MDPIGALLMISSVFAGIIESDAMRKTRESRDISYMVGNREFSGDAAREELTLYHELGDEGFRKMLLDDGYDSDFVESYARGIRGIYVRLSQNFWGFEDDNRGN